jgi:diguanylate cyclase (GGDEF)-like protein
MIMPLEVYYRVDVNFIAFVVLGIFTWFSFKRLDLTDKLNRLFIFVSITVLFQLLIETSTVFINERDTLIYMLLSNFLHVVLFAVGAYIAYLWFYFQLQFIFRKDEIPKYVYRISKGLLAIAIFLSLSSPLTGWVFTINDQNVYTRGPLFIHQMAITYLFIVSSIFCIIKYRRRLTREDRHMLYVFAFLPVIAGSFQVFIYGILLIWGGIAFTLVIGYSFLRERTIQLDYLTQAVTRESFIRYIERRTLRGIEDTFGMAFLDMNGLKMINDQFGHIEGDFALQTVVKLIKQNIDQKEWIVRMGGDEFLIVLNTDSRLELNKRLHNIEKTIIEYNQKTTKPYQIIMSYGADLFNQKEHELSDFIRRLDHEMYEAKKKSKKAL